MKINLPNSLLAHLMFFAARKMSYPVSSSKETPRRASRASRMASPFPT
jgi:hypothetical protein